MKHILLIDHHDSFTYNIVELFRQQKDCTITVKKPEVLQLKELEIYNGIVLSPGAGLPSEQSQMKTFIYEAIKIDKPLLGICLGYQGLVEYFGGQIKLANNICHGEASIINIDNKGIYNGLPTTIQVGRYHSWIADKKTFPKELIINASTTDGTIMGFKHKTLNINGVQYHPESVLTNYGNRIIANWLYYCINKQ